MMEEMVSKYKITIGEKEFVVEIGNVSSSPVEVVVNGERKTVAFDEVSVMESVAASAPAAAPVAAGKSEPEAAPASEPQAAPASVATGEVVVAPMPGKLLSIVVAVGDTVSEGDTVCTLEAMKMEMPISSTVSGTVQAILVSVGDNVANDDPLVSIG